MTGDKDMDREAKSVRPAPRDEWKPLRLELHTDSITRIPARPPRQDQLYQLLPVWQMSSDRVTDASAKSGR